MENMYVWLFLFAGATIALLGMLLLASERQLKEKRRELQEILRNRSDGALDLSRDSETQASIQNQELLERISLLSSRLEESQRSVAELQAEQERVLRDAQSEKQKLGVENQQRQQEIADLRNQLQASETRLGANANQYAELTERHAQLQFDIAELKQQLDQLSEEKNSLSSRHAAAQRTIEELRTIREAMQSESQHLQAANQELQRELAKLNLDLQTSESRLGEATREAQDSTDRYSKLQREAAELKEQLESSQMMIEELRAEQERLAGIHLENQKLRQESTDLREQLERSETRLAGLSRQNQEAADHYARLKGEAAELTRQLDETQAKIRELDALQHELASAQSRERILRGRQDDQETQIDVLRRDLSAAEGKVQELDVARSRMAEMERRYQELSHENRRLEEEISRLQEHLDRSAENQRQSDVLQRQLDGSQIKHAQPIDLNDGALRLSPSNADLTHILQSTTDAGGEVAREPIESTGANPVERIPSAMALPHARFSIDGSGEIRDHHRALPADDSGAAMAVENEATSASAVRAPRRKKSRIATISAVVVLAVTAGGGVGFLGTRYLSSKDASATREFAPDERWTPSETASPTAETKPALRLQGKFKITRATEVYSGPTEKSALITRIEPGMKINVVDSRDGWLEIRSKYGRPPGFVREEAAVKIDQN
jgi:chromosome segregation ATPase